MEKAAMYEMNIGSRKFRLFSPDHRHYKSSLPYIITDLSPRSILDLPVAVTTQTLIISHQFINNIAPLYHFSLNCPVSLAKGFLTLHVPPEKKLNRKVCLAYRGPICVAAVAYV